MSNLFSKVLNFGIQPSTSFSERKSIVLLNTINLLLFLVTFILTILELFYNSFELDGNSGVLRILTPSLVCLTGIVLTWKRKINWSKGIVVFIPVLIFAYFPTIFNEVRNEYFFFVPFVIISLSIVPHFVLSVDSDKSVFVFSLFYYFVVLLTHDVGMIRVASGTLDIIPFVEENFYYYKLSQVSLFVFINLSVYYLRNQNANYEKMLEKAFRDIKYNSMVLTEQSELVQTQNEELKVSNEALQKHQIDLEKTLSQLHDTQQRLIESEKMASIGVLSAGVAHEINNPLNFIQSGLFRLEDAMISGAVSTSVQEVKREQLKAIEVIGEGVDRIHKIVRNLNHFNADEKGRFTVCELNQVIDNCLLILNSKIRSGIDLHVNLPNYSPLVYGNRANLHQAFINIILNALQSIKDEGVICIDLVTIKPAGKIKVTVKDNGCGIPAEYLNRVFDPFFTTKEPDEGKGLGLSTTYNIIQNHRGSIKIDSVENEGATVVVEMPLMKDAKELLN